MEKCTQEKGEMERGRLNRNCWMDDTCFSKSNVSLHHSPSLSIMMTFAEGMAPSDTPDTCKEVKIRSFLSVSLTPTYSRTTHSLTHTRQCLHACMQARSHAQIHTLILTHSSPIFHFCFLYSFHISYFPFYLSVFFLCYFPALYPFFHYPTFSSFRILHLFLLLHPHAPPLSTV